MKLTKVDGMNHVGPVSVSSPEAENIMTGPYSFSITKFINCVTLDNITLCDTPGFEDTQGPEVDIANGYGVIEGIKKTKSIIPVLVFSDRSMGERCSGLRRITKLIVQMFSNIDNIKKCFYYVFTKFTET
jgi:predicted GTPase